MNVPFTMVPDDMFFKDLYEYHQGSGFLCILLTHICYLLTVLFMILFSTFLLQCVDWKGIHDGQKDTLYNAIYPMCKPPSGRNGAIVFSFVIFITYWIILSVKTMMYLWRMRKIHNFWTGVLGLSSDVQWVTWQMVIDAYHERNDPLVDSHFIVSRIMRWDNYLIAMLTKNVFGWDNWSGMFTKVLEWNVEKCIMSSLFRDDGILIDDVIVENRRAEFATKLRKTFMFYGVLNVIFAPFVISAMSVYFIYRYVSEYHKNPKAMGIYNFTPLAKWKLRDLNELPHTYTSRLNRAHPKIIEYLGQFVNEGYNIVLKFITFVLGSMLLILVIVSFFNPDIIVSLFLVEQPVIFYVGVMSALFVVFQNSMGEPPLVYEPDEKFYELVKILHCTPSSWANMSTRERYLEIRRMFRYKWVVFLQEIFSVVYVPLVLLLWLPHRSEAIVDFFRENSVGVKKLGTVCSCAMFQSDHRMVRADADDDDVGSVTSCSSMDRKVTTSLMNFKQSYPTWDPSRFPRPTVTHITINREYEERLELLRQQKEQREQRERLMRMQQQQQLQRESALSRELNAQMENYAGSSSSSKLVGIPGSYETPDMDDFIGGGEASSSSYHTTASVLPQEVPEIPFHNTGSYSNGSSSFDMNLPFQLHLTEDGGRTASSSPRTQPNL